MRLINFRNLLSLAALAAPVCLAGTIGSLADPTKDFSFLVPAALEGKSSPGGWGALVLTFDQPITGGTFIFNPECPAPTAGNLNPNDNTNIQLGPGNYGLLPTGSEVTKPGPNQGMLRGMLQITITYTGNVAPNVVDGFWQSKLTVKQGDTRVRVFAFDASQDMGLLPEPSTLLLCAGGLLLLVLRARRFTPGTLRARPAARRSSDTD